MSTEILPGKLNPIRSVSGESSIVVEKKKERKKGAAGLMLFLMAVGLGAVALTSITVLAPVTFYDDGNSSGSIIDTGNSAAIPTALAASVKATDGKGNMIENNGVIESGEITVSEYFDGTYSTKLHCSIDSLLAYCDGRPVTIPNLPVGTHKFTIVYGSNEEMIPLVFTWKNIPANQ